MSASTPTARAVPLWLACLSVVAAILGIAAWYQPLPNSDWEYYWLAATEPARYVKGGLALPMIGALKLAGLPPWAAASLLNAAAAVLLLWSAWRAGGRRPSLVLALVAAYLLATAPYYGLVGVDLMASSLLGCALVLALPRMAAGAEPASARLCWGIVALVGVAVSMRLQFLLVFPASIAVIALAGLLRGPRDAWRGMAAWRVVAALALGTVLGFGVHAGARQLGSDHEALRTHTGVTLYAGLLASEVENCGTWSPDATAAAVADKDLPLPEAIRARLASRPAAHWGAVMACKFPQIALPGGYAASWLSFSPRPEGATWTIADVPPEQVWRVMGLEQDVLHLLAIAMYGLLLASALQVRRLGLVALWPAAWVLGFWCVHLVLEIQPRYFLPMVLLGTLGAGALWGAGKGRSVGAPA